MNHSTDRLARRRRVFDALEARVVQLYLDEADAELEPLYWHLRYALSFARLTAIRRSEDGVDVDVDGPLQLHAWSIRDLLTKPLEARSLWKVARVVPEVVQRTRQARASLLEHLPIPREDLEAEVHLREGAETYGPRTGHQRPPRSRRASSASTRRWPGCGGGSKAAPGRWRPAPASSTLALRRVPWARTASTRRGRVSPHRAR